MGCAGHYARTTPTDDYVKVWRELQINANPIIISTAASRVAWCVSALCSHVYAVYSLDIPCISMRAVRARFAYTRHTQGYTRPIQG